VSTRPIGSWAPAAEVAGQRTDTVVTAPVLDVVIPVFNEEAALATSVRRVVEHLETLPWSFRVTVADNASVDATSSIARRLSFEDPRVRAVHLSQKGRGRALRRVWSRSDAMVLVYMDVDLSTDLGALLPLVAPLISGHSDLAIGSRLVPSARVSRGMQREVISRCYNLILRGALRVGFSDAQCGFKAIRRDAASELLPLVADEEWFFDTELLTVAERAGLRIHEVPVDWVDDPDSRVDIARTAWNDLRGVWRLGRALARRQLPLGEVAARLGRTPRAAFGRRAFDLAMLGAGAMATAIIWTMLRG
jgi:glycosyltransferase involved in cell wall biosynthesis